MPDPSTTRTTTIRSSGPGRGFTVGELREALAALPDGAHVRGKVRLTGWLHTITVSEDPPPRPFQVLDGRGTRPPNAPPPPRAQERPPTPPPAKPGPGRPPKSTQAPASPLQPGERTGPLESDATRPPEPR